MNVQGARKAYKKYLRQHFKPISYEGQSWQERALHAEAVLETLVIVGFFGNHPTFDFGEGHTFGGTPITADNIPDGAIIDLESPLTEADIAHMTELAKHYGFLSED